METVVPPPADAELRLLMDWGGPGDRVRIRRAVAVAAGLSLLIHVIAIVFLLFVPETFMQPPHRLQEEAVVTPLIDPPMTLTQKEPNTNKVVRPFRSADLTPRVKSPAGPSPDPARPAPHKATPPPPPPKAAPQTSLPEPPKVDIAANETPKLTFPVQPPA